MSDNQAKKKGLVIDKPNHREIVYECVPQNLFSGRPTFHTFIYGGLDYSEHRRKAGLLYWDVESAKAREASDLAQLRYWQSLV